MSPQLFDIQLSGERQVQAPESGAFPRTSIAPPSVKPLNTTTSINIHKEESQVFDINDKTDVDSRSTKMPAMEMINMGGKKVIVPTVPTCNGSDIMHPK